MPPLSYQAQQSPLRRSFPGALVVWAVATGLGTALLLLGRGVEGLDRVPVVAMMSMLPAIGGLVFLEHRFHQRLRQQMRALFEETGANYGLRPDPAPKVGVSGVWQGLHLRLYWRPETGGQKHSRRQPHGFLLEIRGPLGNVEIHPADGTPGPDRLPGSGDFLRVVGDPADLSTRLDAADLQRLYDLIVEHGWRVGADVLIGDHAPALWDADELESLIAQGLALAALLGPSDPQVNPHGTPEETLGDGGDAADSR